MPTSMTPNSSLLQQMLLWGEEEGSKRATSRFLFSHLHLFLGLLKHHTCLQALCIFLAVTARNPYMKKKHIRILIRVLKLEWKEIEIISKDDQGQIKGLYICKISQHWKRGCQMSVSRENVFLVRKSLRIMRAKILVRYYWRSVFASTDSTETLCVWKRQQRVYTTQENALIACSKSGSFFLLFCSYD